MLWSLTAAKKKVSANQCHMIVSRAQVYKSLNGLDF